MAKKEQQKEEVTTLEKGSMYFFYRPKVNREEPHGMADIQRLYMILSPEGDKHYRRIVVGHKKMPDPSGKGKKRFWGFVDKVTTKPQGITRDLQEEHYQTKTRGEQVRPAARPVGEGVYKIVRHDNHTHIVYALELPSKPQEAQDALNIEKEASYIISVKNPAADSPPQAGLSAEQEADFPKTLMKEFRDRRFSELDPTDFLNYEGAELMFISAAEDVAKELGIELQPQQETKVSAELFTDLQLDEEKHPLEPALSGQWQ